MRVSLKDATRRLGQLARSAEMGGAIVIIEKGRPIALMISARNSVARLTRHRAQREVEKARTEGNWPASTVGLSEGLPALRALR
jgi:antitoxin (DNA-binding transcriptional repressor) of toxin-antitoxin stability system